MLWYILSVVTILCILFARKRFVRATIFEFQRGLRYRNGRFVRVLGPGRYWIMQPGTTITPVDVRPAFVTLAGQEVLTADGVPLKVSIAASYEISDPVIAINGQANYTQALYLVLQLAVREAISGSNVDALLENRAGFAEKMRSLAEPGVRQLGVKLIGADLKDLMIASDLKKSFAQIVKARKDGEAALERARGETAALRSIANAARMVQESPQLMQIRMLQVMGQSAGNTLVVGMPATSVPFPVGERAAKAVIEKDTEGRD